jgi:Uma2 family endonuclease
MLPLRRITVEEYERIGDTGVLDDPEKVELIDGYVVDKMPKHPEHSYTTKQTLKAFDSRLPPGWTSRHEQPVRIPDYDEPEPDIAIIRGSDADYRHRHPGPRDVALVIEVSEATLTRDRGPKRSVFARARIPVYWIINLVARQVEVYTQPLKEGRYRSRKVFKPGQQIPVVIGGQALRPIDVDDLLP